VIQPTYARQAPHWRAPLRERAALQRAGSAFCLLWQNFIASFAFLA